MRSICLVCNWIVWWFILTSPGVEGENLTIVNFLSEIKRHQGFDYVLLMKNTNATIIFNFITPEYGGYLAKLVMEGVESPVIQMSELNSFFLHNIHSSRLVSVAYIDGFELDHHGGLFKALIANLRHINVSPVILLLNIESKNEQFLYKIFKVCWELKLLSVVALFANHQETGKFYSYSNFPRFVVEEYSYDYSNIPIFIDRLKDLKGYEIPIIVGGSVPRIISYYTKDRQQVIYHGTVGHFMDALEQKHNCKLTQPFPMKPDDNAPSINTIGMVRNGTVEISMGITFPAQLTFSGISYPYELMNWCIMMPVEADLPPAKYYINVFRLDAFLLTILTLVIISVSLATFLWRYGYRVYTYEFLLHDNTLRGALGQSFVVVFEAPILVRWIYLQICILGILLTTLYNAYFSAYVTSQPKEPPLRSYDDILASKLKIVTWKPEYEELLGRLVEFRKYAPIFLVEPEYSRYITMRDSFNIRYGYMMNSGKWVVVNEQQKIFSEVLFRLKDNFCFINNLPMGFPIHDNSIYVEPLKMLIMELWAHGLLEHWVKTAFWELIVAGQLSLEDLSPHRQFRAMREMDLQYIWYGYAVAILLATQVFLMEILWNRITRKR